MEIYVQIVRENCGVRRMSDDLISRKSLIENLKQFAPEHYNALVNNLIMKEPTAFDKEKVINEIRNVPHGYYNAETENEIIEIIEKGGLK